MKVSTIFCEECVEDIPGDEIAWNEERLYCKRCGSDLEAPSRDIFEEILDNSTGFLFRSGLDDEVEEEEEMPGITIKNDMGGEE